MTEAITKSCNYFFAEMGYRMGMDTFREYLQAFGLGAHRHWRVVITPVPCPAMRRATTRPPGPPSARPTSSTRPSSFANYIATLASGGQHCKAHLLKAVKSYDNTEVLAVGDTAPTNVVSMQDSTLEAVKKGMLGYTSPAALFTMPSGTVWSLPAPKTGTSELGGNQTENGVFVLLRPL